jgi:macrophage erythroblast attacher
VYYVSFEDPLPQKLAIGLSTLKSVCCCDPSKRNEDVCPLCVEHAVEVARRVPMLTKEGSSLKCRVNGSIMDEENYPVVLPSKHIYSISALSAS